MGSFDMNCTLLALGLANAVAEDEKDGGFDLSVGMFGLAVSQWLRGVATDLQKPIDMVLHCPKCHKQHIDEPFKPGDTYAEHCLEKTLAEAWTNPPHKSHLCHGCGYIWRPADVPTNGVIDTKTHGKDDSPKEAPQ